jgi:peptide deformylase
VSDGKTTRYRDIEVKYQDPTFKWQKQKFSGPIAQAIQHECDHLEGIII